MLDLKKGLVGESEERPATCLWDVHVRVVPRLEIWEGSWEYFNNAAMLLAMKFGVHNHDAEDAVRSAAFLGNAGLAVWKEGGFAPYTHKIVRTGDIAFEQSRIIPGYDHIGDTIEGTIEGTRYPMIYVNLDDLEKLLAANSDICPPVVFEEGAPSDIDQSGNTKQFGRVLEAFEQLPAALRNEHRKRGWRQRIANEISKMCPDIKDIPRVLREVLKALETKEGKKPES